MTVPLSILDLAPISGGDDAATALRNTVDLARTPSSGATADTESPSTTSSLSPAPHLPC
jgi:hypothetical protein